MSLIKEFYNILNISTCLLAVDSIHTKHIEPALFNAIAITIA